MAMKAVLSPPLLPLWQPWFKTTNTLACRLPTLHSQIHKLQQGKRRTTCMLPSSWATESPTPKPTQPTPAEAPSPHTS